MSLKSINPKNDRLVREYSRASPQAVERALSAAAAAFRRHRQLPWRERAEQLDDLADRLDDGCAELARLITDEMGKTLSAALAEVRKCAWVCRHYAEHGEAMLRDESLASDDYSSCRVQHQSLGPVLAVMPWNFPLWQVFRFTAPAVMAGNVVLLKHASNVPRTALRLQELFEAAGFLPGAFQTLLIGPERVEEVLADRRVRAATVTGSVKAGTAVASIAGRYGKKTVLELGGSDPFIVMPSADLEPCIEAAVTARTLNNGQSCIAAKRFMVHDKVYEAFVEGFANGLRALRIGDPVLESTDLGPLALSRLSRRLDRQVRTLLERGAERILGATPIEGPGNFFEPGILAGIDDDAPPFDEELFGPVAWVLRVADLEDAIVRANQTQYGLGSSIWTRNRDEAALACREIEAGATFVNSIVQSEPGLPFGGIKASGYGRELARDGILEFVNRKTVAIA